MICLEKHKFHHFFNVSQSMLQSQFEDALCYAKDTQVMHLNLEFVMEATAREFVESC